MENLPYSVIRSSRRTIALEIRPDGTVLVRCPRRMSEKAVAAFVASRRSWLESHLATYRNRPAQPRLTEGELAELKRRAAAYFPERTERFAPLVGVSFGRITIRAQRSRWGSCSGKGNLNFNCLLMLAPEPVREYVVIHELCHRKQMNHSPRFWAEVERVMPEYGQALHWLKDNGSTLLARLPE